MQDKIQEFRACINDIIASLLAEKGSKYFYALAISLFAIYLTKRKDMVARITPNAIIVSTEFFKLSPEDQKFTLCHEIGHYLRGHLQYNIDLAMNIAMDMVINSRLLEDGFEKMDDVYYLEDLADVCPLKELRKMSEPEIRDLVLKKYNVPPRNKRFVEGLGGGQGSKNINPHDFKPEDKEDLIKLKEGSFNSRKYFDNLTQLKDMLEKIIKVAGTDAGSFKELIEFEVKRPTWKIKLRKSLSHCLRRKSKLDLTRQNRKTPDYFAKKRFSKIKEVLISIDTSGSMSPHELSKAIGLILGYCRARDVKKVKIVQWDAEIHEIRDYKATIKKLEIKGRGGTKLMPFLRWLEAQTKRMLVILCSDWYLFDEDESKKLLKKLERKHAIIGISTSDKNPLTSIKIKIQ